MVNNYMGGSVHGWFDLHGEQKYFEAEVRVTCSDSTF